MIRTRQLVLPLVLAAMCAGIGQAQAVDPCASAPQTCASTINTRASASKRLANSAVDVIVGITAEDKQIADAQRELTQHTATLLAWLRAHKVARLATESVNVVPETHTEKNAADRIVGYTASTSVSFRAEAAAAPALLAGALTNGANTISSTSFTPTEEEIRAARRELSAEAVRTAISQADAIAKAAELHVIAIKSINVENQGSFNPRPMNSRAMSAGFTGLIDTAAGDQEITVSVDVVVAAKP